MAKKPTLTGLCREVGEIKQELHDHLTSDTRQRIVDQNDRLIRQELLDKRLTGMETNITAILDIKKSTEAALKAVKWVLGVGATIAAIWKTGILNALFHKQN
jgi:uncharacterized ion transporter superfamily protein YfcC